MTEQHIPVPPQNVTDVSHPYTYKANSFLTGKFVMPINADATNTTLQICLCSDAAGINTIKTFDVKLSDADGGNKNFPLLADRFYGIGQKTANDSDPDNIDNPDNPADLSKDQEITIQVKANWSVIYDLDVE